MKHISQIIAEVGAERRAELPIQRPREPIHEFMAKLIAEGALDFLDITKLLPPAKRKAKAK